MIRVSRQDGKGEGAEGLSERVDCAREKLTTISCPSLVAGFEETASNRRLIDERILSGIAPKVNAHINFFV